MASRLSDRIPGVSCTWENIMMMRQETVQQLTFAPIQERIRMIELILQSLKQDMQFMTVQKPVSSTKDELLGLFADEADLIDEITASAMQARERDQLRVA